MPEANSKLATESRAYSVISVDAMGGDSAPAAVVDAVHKFLLADSHVKFILFGDKLQVEPLLPSGVLSSGRVQLVHTEVRVLDDDKPTEAIRARKGSSMQLAIEAVKKGLADACVSSGNTGALMVLTKLILKTMPGIQRPAIIAQIPTLHGQCAMLDLGANSECDESILFEFALMGVCFARSLLKLESPSVGLLNIGVEQGKGRELETKTYALLQNSGLNFSGFIEAHNIAEGRVDVVVADGFSGNLVLKASEGVVRMFFQLLRQSCNENGVLAKIGGLLLKKSLKKQFSPMNPAMNNGAMLIGANGIVIKSHGSSDAQGVFNALKVAVDLVKNNINDAIAKELSQLEANGIKHANN